MIFKDKNIIVTGGARGIGEAISTRLASQGANIIIWDVLEDVARETAAKLASEHGVTSTGAAVDVTNMDAVEEAAKQIKNDFGTIDGLINNAGITRDNIILRMKEDEWDLVLKVNLKGAFVCTKAVARYMLKARAGRIINMASIIGAMGNAGQANYAASKGGLIAFTKSAAKEFAPRGVTVNAIAPGFIRTAMTDALPEEVQKQMLDAIPLGKFGEVDDIAAATEYLLSEGARYVTGQVMHVNGGMYV